MSEQDAGSDGNGSRVVPIAGQGAGDGPRAAAGHPHLTLIAHRPRPPRPDHELDWLLPENRAVPLIGREPELAALRAWRDAGRGISVRVLTGHGGSGKTRLALALVDAARAEGWVAGFVSGEELTRFRVQHNHADWDWQQPTLIVIDHAATCAPALRGWLSTLATHAAGGPPLRLLLLERHAEPGSGWWQRVFEAGSWTAEAVRELLDPPQPLPLAQLADPGERRAVLSSLLAGLGCAQLVPDAGTKPDFDRRLATGDGHGDPLYLLMAGLYGAHAGLNEALALSRQTLAGRLAVRELARLRRFADSHRLSPELLVLLAALATLCAGLPRCIAIPLAAQARATLKRSHGSDAAQLCEALHLTLPAADDGIAPVLPGLIGEALLLHVLSSPENHRHAEGFIEQAWSATGLPVAVTLMHCVQDFAGDDPDPCAEPWRLARGWLERLAGDARHSAWTLMALIDALPAGTAALQELAASVIWTISELLPEDLDTAPQRARAMLDAAASLSARGQPAVALVAAQAAVDLQRKLAALRPEAFTADLTAALNRLAAVQHGAGQCEAALASAQEAVDLGRTLATAGSEALTPLQVTALDQLADYHSELGRFETERAAAQEAVGLGRRLAGVWPDAFTATLAGSLNRLARSLGELGQREAALAAVQEGVALRRRLAAAQPAAFTPALARSLDDLARSLSGLGQQEAALAAVQEAVELRTRLATEQPEAFLPALAGSLNNLAIVLGELGQREAALAAAQQAVELQRTLAGAWPKAFRPDLAGSLNNLANRLIDLGRREAALAAAQEAVEVYRALAGAQPEAFTHELATAWHTLASCLSSLGRREAALAAAQAAVDLRRPLAGARPEAYTPELAMSLNSLANRLSELGRSEAAIVAAREAVDRYRVLVAARPEAFTADLAGALNNFANILSDLGQGEVALEAARETVDLYRALASVRPEAFKPDLSTSLNNLANRLRDLGRQAAALTAAQEAVATLTPFFLQLPVAYAPQMATMLQVLSELLEACSQPPDMQALQPVLAVFQQLQASADDDAGEA